MTSNASESVRYRIRRAKDTLVEAQAMAQIGHWNACVNRLYYACLCGDCSAASAQCVDPETHSNALALAP